MRRGRRGGRGGGGEAGRPRRTSHRAQHDPHDGHPPPRRTPPHPAPPLRARARAPTTVIDATRPPVRPAVAHPAPPGRHPPSQSVRPSETPATGPGQHKTPTATTAGVCSESDLGTHEPVGTESVASVHRSCSARSAWIWRYTRSPPMAASATRRSFFTVRPRLSLT